MTAFLLVPCGRKAFQLFCLSNSLIPKLHLKTKPERRIHEFNRYKSRFHQVCSSCLYLPGECW
jgi:hypothetical protein